MNKPITAALAAVALALSGAAFAQDSAHDSEPAAARQARMDEAYRDHQQQQQGTLAHAEASTKRGLNEAGHAIEHGATAAGHAIKRGAVATGHAIRRGAHATSNAIHRGLNSHRSPPRKTPQAAGSTP